jgi:hypothetical protein
MDHIFYEIEYFSVHMKIIIFHRDMFFLVNIYSRSIKAALFVRA